MGLLSLCFLINQCLVVVMPLAVGVVIDRILPSGSGVALNYVILGLIAFLLIRSIAIFAERELSALVGTLVVRDVRLRVHRHMLRMSLRYLDEYRIGRIVSRILGDSECVRQLLLSGFVNGVSSGVRLVIIAVTLAIIDWRMTIVSGFTLPFFFLGFWWAANKLKPAYRELNENNASLTASVNETFAGMRVIKTYCGERRIALDFMSRLHRIIRQSLYVSRTQHWITIVWEGTAWLSVVGMLWFGGHRVIAGGLTAGSLVAFYGLLGQLHGPIADLINLNATLQPAMASIEALDDILETEPDIVDRPGAREARQLRGEVEFHDVEFSYVKPQLTESGIHAKTMNKISFRVKAGECVAIVGASGSGKSTLINLLARLYDVDHGCIKVDGTDIRNYRLRSYLSNIAMVLQDNFLFQGTLRDNIRYSRWNASEEEIIRASKMAGAWEFICDLPEGLDAVCGERGMTLSGGQRQRLALARAILANPRILILDEATSALDSRIEKQIQNALEQLMKGRTTFIVAHRLSTIVNADKILVLDHGQIIEMGTHAELLVRNGRYAEMYNEQFAVRASHPVAALPVAALAMEA